ncbi:MAG: bifunctional adenosylcobinamide kinase/adenosylcobinamide-phosphate guanylyltransferase, partial [Ilumatobacter sp.]
MALTLLIGGARSGKSSLAVDIGHRHEAAGDAVSFVATAPALDDDMSGRIERHRDERPSSWSTVEEEVDLAGAISSVDEG